MATKTKTKKKVPTLKQSTVKSDPGYENSQFVSHDEELFFRSMRGWVSQ